MRALVKHYAPAFAGLLVLTTLALGTSLLSLGGAGIALGIGIALAKSVLVAIVFMHLAEHHTSSALTLVVALILVGLLIGLSVLDVVTRRELPPLATDAAPAALQARPRGSQRLGTLDGAERRRLGSRTATHRRASRRLPAGRTVCTARPPYAAHADSTRRVRDTSRSAPKGQPPPAAARRREPAGPRATAPNAHFVPDPARLSSPKPVWKAWCGRHATTCATRDETSISVGRATSVGQQKRRGGEHRAEETLVLCAAAPAAGHLPLIRRGCDASVHLVGGFVGVARRSLMVWPAVRLGRRQRDRHCLISLLSRAGAAC